MKDGGKQNIILCGFMGTGKSSVGRKLAAMTGYDFLDMDAVIEKKEGISIPQIFATRGESAFRQLESDLVKRIASDMERYVIATGGGAIVNPDNLILLKRAGVVVTLTAAIPVILDRVGSGDDRPMLHAADRVERVTQLLEKRNDAYAQADIVLDTSTLSIDEAACEILVRIREFGFSF